MPPDVSLTPVEGDPFGPVLTPVDHDPFAGVRSPYAPETPEAATGTLSAYTPSWSDRLRQFVEEAASGAGASKSYSQNLGEGAQGVAGLVPGLGNALSANQAYRNYEGGNYVGAGLDTLAAIPLPGASIVEGAAAKGAESAAEKEAARIIAYHGSPHTFDQFDLGAIGTGEGAQAYGNGLYFAENEEIAKYYQDTLGGINQITSGNTASDISLAGRISKMFGNDGTNWDVNGRNIESIAKKFTVDTTEDPTTGATIHTLRDGSKWINGGDWWDVSELPLESNMYQVAINANSDHFLDWDKPLSEQPPKVREALQKFGIPFEEDWRLSNSTGGENTVDMRPVTGDSAYHKIASQFSSPTEASQALRDAGIPGIKYLDAGSRAKGDGSRNYVVFDDKMIDILKRYGIAGLGLGAGASAFLGQDNSANATTLTPVDYDPFVPQSNPQGAQPVAPPMPGM